ncbi:hypothetical protein KUV85_07205 [Nocardioides panacisoli]|uniref:zinc ribbon domain-containing protein n=1 Tax=Nocardioides panacisoli TaxID=627624 RepID=UPI001C639B44|nr:C4-type zinc ribbon domain-containing protein [Nocardioides panacisoli]QYJ05462.1 hypothetical protein KUV85_07205 [Nocardioides panacisoli]
MNADPFAQLKLLDVQALDSETDQLRHRLSNLPEDAELATLTTEQARVRDAVRDQQVVVDDLDLAQRKADRDVEQVKERRERDRARMDSGQVTDPKALEQLQHEMDSLERRISTLEDEELEVMEQLEDAQRTLTAAQEREASLAADVEALTATRDRKRTEIEDELARVIAGRDPMIADMPEDLLALYEKLRANKGGIGAALLRAKQCGGCMLSLDASEIERLRQLPTESVARCEECQRILVRTGESGL